MDRTTGQIKEYLRELKLLRMEKIFDRELALASKENVPASTLIGRLLEAEVQAGRARRIERRIRESTCPNESLRPFSGFRGWPLMLRRARSGTNNVN